RGIRENHIPMSIHHTPAFRAAEMRHLSPPEPDPVICRIASMYLTEGIYSGEEVTINCELSHDLTIFDAWLAETGEEIDPQEIGDYDRAEFAEHIHETTINYHE